MQCCGFTDFIHLVQQPISVIKVMETSNSDLDPDITIMYLPKNKLLVDRHSLKVNLSREFDRKVLPAPFEDDVEKVWNEKLLHNPTMWNGTKFRLDSVISDENGTTFNIGLTSYKDFIGTNWSPNAKLFHEMGSDKYSNSQAFMSDALGVGSLVHTADDKTVLIKRSMNCGEAVGLWDIPGGHPEPKVYTSLDSDSTYIHV